MSTYDKVYQQFEHGFFGGVALGILASSCIGGAAAMAVLENGTGPWQLFQLILVVASAMLFNGAVLSKQKPRTTFNMLTVSILVNTTLMVINFAMH